MSDWIAHALLVTPAEHRVMAAKIYGQVTGSQEDSGPETYSIALTAVGGGDITHYACHTRVRGSTLDKLPSLAEVIPGSLWLVTGHDMDSEEDARNRPTIDAWLAGHGLTRQESTWIEKA